MLGRFSGIISVLRQEGLVEITTSPLYHPIVPLLLDMNCAKEAVPDIKLPVLPVGFRDDAYVHVKRGKKIAEDWFGTITGIWPSEGSVSPKAVDLYSESGFSYVFTDEDILFRSISKRTGDRSPLYSAYRYGNATIFFRDKILSDLIGFVYKSWDEDKAVEDFVGRLRAILDLSVQEPVVTVALDGENCWEFYRNNGCDFLRALYKRLKKEDWIEMVFPHQVEASQELSNIASGSWIGGNFLTWVGHEEKNRAWELLAKAKMDCGDVPDAREYILIAEGSDWFWWYGDTHFTMFGEEFDILFRSNLRAAYREAKREPPEELFKPIRKEAKILMLHPNYYLSPVVDGEITSYYEWLNAGHASLLQFSTMATSGFYLKELYYGYDKEHNLYLRIDGAISELTKGETTLVLELVGSQKRTFTFDLAKGCALDCESAKIGVGKILEIMIPAECLGDLSCEQVRLTLKLYDRGNLVEEHPIFGFIELELDKDFLQEWFV